jgi:hypothetical protein
MHKQLLTLLLLAWASLATTAQDTSAWKQKPTLVISSFVDAFYVYDFNQPQGNIRLPFVFNHNRHNEFNVNLGLVKFGVEHSKYRANLALHAGTYANDNYAAEPGLLKNIFEANVGLALNKKNTLWLDAGILPSHIGFESAISTENPTLTRSVLAENSPYFLTGAKLSFAPNDKWEIAALVVNGWQRIQRLQGNSLPSFGTQVSFSPSEKVNLNWSTFIGTDDPDTTRRMRYFSNLYGTFQVGEKFNLIAGFDLGTQQQFKESSAYNLWLSLIAIAQYKIAQRWQAAIRTEYYQDETGVMIPTGTNNGFQTIGVSLNIDYAPIKHVMCRIEGRWFNSVDNIFVTPTGSSNNNFMVAASVAVKLPDIRIR